LLEFQSFEPNQNNYEYSPTNLYAPSPSDFLSPGPSSFQPNIFTPTFDTQPEGYKDHPANGEGFEDEPSLLEELEIYPTRIVEKSLAVLNPFHARGLSDDAEYLFKDTDLAGPITFYLTLAFCLFLSDSRKDMFGYVYGLSVITVFFMYILMKLMSTTINEPQDYITLSSVASILGYSILPIVWLSVPGIFFSLNNKFGIILAAAAVFLSTKAASRVFCLMTGDQKQRYLIAYPCGLIYVIFALLVLF
jgi:protein YIPF5/7